MRTIVGLATFLLLVAAASNSIAQGLVSLNWNTCEGPVERIIAPGNIAAFYVSVLGQTQLHKAYDVRVLLTQVGDLKDAWRFDAPGCQGVGLLAIDFYNPLPIGKTCPAVAFMQTSAPSLQIKDYSYDSLSGKARGLLANSYPNGVTAVNPAIRYLLARFNFDHSFSANGPSDPGNTCGGLDAPLCAHLSNASWLNLDGQQIPWAISQEFVLANDPFNFIGCPFVGGDPVRTTSWGSIKSQYRN